MKACFEHMTLPKQGRGLLYGCCCAQLWYAATAGSETPRQAANIANKVGQLALHLAAAAGCWRCALQWLLRPENNVSLSAGRERVLPNALILPELVLVLHLYRCAAQLYNAAPKAAGICDRRDQTPHSYALRRGHRVSLSVCFRPADRYLPSDRFQIDVVATAFC